MTTNRRVPVVLQATLDDCGAACLAMVLRYHGRAIDFREVRTRLGVSRDGLTALALTHAARSFGLTARAFSVAPGDLAGVTPAVVHWQFNHFVVLHRWSASGVELVDPAVGRRRMTCDEFAAGFTGVVILFEPGPAFERRAVPWREAHPWRRHLLHSLVRRHRGFWAQLLVASLALQLLGLAVATATEILVDDVLPAHRASLMSMLGVGLGLAVLCQFVLRYLRATLLASLRLRIDLELTSGVVRHLLDLPYSFFARRGAADLVARTGSVSAVRQIVAGSVVPTLIDAPLAISYLVLVFMRDPVLGGAVAAIAILQVGTLIGTRRRISELSQQELIAQSAAQGCLIETIRGIETVKAAGADVRAMDHWRHRFVTQLNASTRTQQTTGVIDAALASVHVLAPVVLLWVAAWRVLDGDLSLGTMLAVTALASTALTPLASVANNLQVLQTLTAHLSRLTDIIEAEPEPAGARRPPPAPLRGAIELRDVSFRHDPRGRWVLRNICLRAAPGQKLALVGRSGSGKSTLAHILLGLYEPTRGEVHYDGIPASELDLKMLRSRFGVVTQDPALFTATIRENISLGDPGAPMHRVVEAARLACIHDEIADLPMGYDTMLLEGDGMSGGQRQRIAIARALLTRPDILVLDEATSHLDTETEAAIERNLSRLRQTRIVIAHRLSTVRDADAIVVLHQGQVVECGSPGELIAVGDHYDRLMNVTATPAEIMPARLDTPDGDLYRFACRSVRSD